MDLYGVTLPRLCLITDSGISADLISIVTEALDAGLPMIQLREKYLDKRQVWKLAQKLRDLTAHYKARLIINRDLDIALAVEADGIHVGKDSLPIPLIRNLLSQANNAMIIGYSAHSLIECQMAEKDGADYLFFSPIYSTPSKAQYGEPQGIDRLKEVIGGVNLPVFALGGIKQANLSEVLAQGAHGAALISEILCSKEPGNTTRSLLQLLA